MNELKICINARKSGYGIEQCGNTLTIGELKEILERYPDDTPIYVSNDKGYTYGEIKWNDIEEKYVDDEEFEEEEE